MRIAILSCFHPFRGGISQFNAGILQGLAEEGHTVKAFNFTRQYPSLLFPGKTQYVTPDDEAVPVESEAVLDTANPFTWGRTARKIRAWKPDLLVMRYWMSWFAPSLGHVARRAGCPAVAIVDNAVPHEKRIFDTPLTKYFFKGCAGFISIIKKMLISFDLEANGQKNIDLFNSTFTDSIFYNNYIDLMREINSINKKDEFDDFNFKTNLR